MPGTKNDNKITADLLVSAPVPNHTNDSSDRATEEKLRQKIAISLRVVSPGL